MADVITRFRLETTQYDSKLRDATKSLKEIGRIAEIGGKDFTKFSQKQVEAARALGNTASGANNVKDRLKELVGAFNDAAKAYNNLSAAQQQSDFGKAMSNSLEQLQTRIKETKQELYGLGDGMKGGGGLFGGDMMKGMLQVAGGNLITMASSWAAGLVGDVKNAIIQSAELARQTEGVQIAFKRLGRGDILDGLREATHGTVSDLELMKAAVKFQDFKLPVEELGTMLAFAQQKAKDTGQSIDYMVDSIVTGLGRKSLMILDNLGLSAAEIKERMAETGDMTKAVGEIIREQMSKAGDYVETAADRVAKANVALNNQMLELGNTMQDVLGFSGWDELATKIKTEVVGALQFTIETIGEAKNAWNSFMQAIGVQEKPNKKSSGGSQRMADGTYWESTDAQGNITASGRWLNGKRVQTGLGDVVITPNHSPKKSTSRTTTRKAFDASVIAFNGGEGFKAAPNDNFLSVWGMMGGDQGLRQMMGIGEQTRDWGKELGQVFADYVADPDKEKRDKANKNEKDLVKNLSTLTSGISTLTSGIKGLGIDLPKEVDDVIGIITSLTSIIQGVQTIISIFGNTAMAANTAAIIANTAAITANTVTNFLPFANGGIVRAANGYVDGNTYSNDQIPALLNAGELVLNRSQQGVLASALNGGLGAMQLSAIITGEQIRLVLNNNSRRTGRGEYVTTNFR